MRPSPKAAWSLTAGLLLALALAIHGPSLRAGLRGEDYVQRAMLRGAFPVSRGPLDLFDFASGTEADNARLRDTGYLPWWSEPSLRLRMWRPLASAWLAAQHAVFDRNAFAHHLVSFAWLAAMLAAAALALARMLPQSLAAPALVVFALAEAHVVPTAWVASQSALMANTFAFLALCACLRRPPAPLGVMLLSALALAAGEYALGALAYVVVFTLRRAELPPRARVRALWPVALPLACYLAVQVAGGGSSGSGYYLGPAALPFAIVTRGPVLLADLVFGVPASWFTAGTPWRDFVLSHRLVGPELWRALPDWTAAHLALGAAAVLAYVAAARFALARTDAPLRGPLLSCALAVPATLAPATAALPSTRLLGAAALGMSVVAVLLLRALVGELRSQIGWRRGATALAAAAVAWIFVVHGFSRARSQATRYRDAAGAAEAWAQEAELPTAGARRAVVYVIAAADFDTATNLPWMRLAFGLPPPRVYRRLSPALAPHGLSRTADQTLELVVRTSTARANATPSLYRSTRHPIAAGETARLPGLAVAVLAARDGNPVRTRFDFDRSLDDPTLWLLSATTGGLVRLHPPPIGASIDLPAPAFPDLRPRLP